MQTSRWGQTHQVLQWWVEYFDKLCNEDHNIVIKHKWQTYRSWLFLCSSQTYSFDTWCSKWDKDWERNCIHFKEQRRMNTTSNGLSTQFDVVFNLLCFQKYFKISFIYFGANTNDTKNLRFDIRRRFRVRKQPRQANRTNNYQQNELTKDWFDK